MKKIILYIFISIIGHTVIAQNQKQPTLALETLEGTWYINQSNFPMWLKGKKNNPTFNYTIGKRKGVLGLKDEVIFSKNGKQKSIVGFDSPINTINTSFVWKGKGILGFLKSKWTILHFDKKENWALIYFKKTLFTPEGYDVISMHKTLNSNVQESIKTVLAMLKIKASLSVIEQL